MVPPDQDADWMRAALEQARLGLGVTSPNPSVGAVIVRDGLVLGLGYHHKAGEPHAERMALADARERGYGAFLIDSTIYVTLEPCSSFGRTPPCTDAIIEAGMKRVVYGASDPDIRHRGRADGILRAAGIEVASGILEKECREMIRGFAMGVKEGRPWVIAKVAMTVDGRLTRKNERWLSGEESLWYAHQLRAECDAVLVGGETVRCDDPALTIRNPLREPVAWKVQPWRVVLTREKSSLPEGSKVFSDEYADRTIVMENVSSLRSDVLEVVYHQYNMSIILLECGGNLLRNFLMEGLVDELVCVQTPWIGGGPVQAFPGDAFLPHELVLTDRTWTPCGEDMILRGKVRFNSGS